MLFPPETWGNWLAEQLRWAAAVPLILVALVAVNFAVYMLERAYRISGARKLVLSVQNKHLHYLYRNLRGIEYIGVQGEIQRVTKPGRKNEILIAVEDYEIAFGLYRRTPYFRCPSDKKPHCSHWRIEDPSPDREYELRLFQKVLPIVITFPDHPDVELAIMPRRYWNGVFWVVVGRYK